MGGTFFLIQMVAKGERVPFGEERKVVADGNDTQKKTFRTGSKGMTTTEIPEAVNKASTATHAAQMVTITLENLPANALVAVDDETTAIPLMVPRSDIPIAIKAFIDDRIIFSKILVPSENQTLTVATRKKGRSKSVEKSDADAAGKMPNDAQWRPSGSLSSNPHPLRRNPFATGDNQ